MLTEKCSAMLRFRQLCDRSQSLEEERAAARRALSLIHHLQRERGATAAYVSGNADSQLSGLWPCQCGTGSLVADLRRRTDRLATREIELELRQLRAQADHTTSDLQACAHFEGVDYKST